VEVESPAAGGIGAHGGVGRAAIRRGLDVVLSCIVGDHDVDVAAVGASFDGGVLDRPGEIDSCRSPLGVARTLGGMSDASRAPDAPVLDVVDDGLSDEEIAARTLAWLEVLRSTPSIRTSETAAEALDHLYADDEL
jgi:hypothetical protein